MLRVHGRSRYGSRVASTTVPRNSSISLAQLGKSPEWQAQGRCRGIDPKTGKTYDPEIFHPSGRGSSGGPAKKICKGCPVIEACLQHALDNDEKHGIWGGLDGRQRKALKEEPVKLTLRERAQKVIEAGEKECPRCQVTKPLGDYARNKVCLDGRSSTCKKCRYELELRARDLKRHGWPVTRAEHAHRLPVRQFGQSAAA